jgi:tRNA threonylcarbamoyladenosine biosynthesis protein TsaE
MFSSGNVTLNDLSVVATEICSYFATQKIVCFVGEMGVGKTTLIKQICKSLGVNENSSSPTYSIVNEYLDASGNLIYHFDLFRIKNERELFDIGFEEYLYSGNICLIEWPQIALFQIEEYLEVAISKIDSNTRNIGLTVKNVS